MKIITCLLLLLLSSCASTIIVRDFEDIGKDSDGNTLYRCVEVK
jgi:hypothetical protein